MILGRRIAFLGVVTLVAFLEGFYLGPLGFDWLIGAVVITMRPFSMSSLASASAAAKLPTSNSSVVAGG
jgi:hypothetical protein